MPSIDSFKNAFDSPTAPLSTTSFMSTAASILFINLNQDQNKEKTSHQII